LTAVEKRGNLAVGAVAAVARRPEDARTGPMWPGRFW